MARRWNWLVWRGVVIGAACWFAEPARAQLEITEIMFDPITEDMCEWVEVHNTTAAPVNLNGWVFDDDDEGTMAASNISSDNGNTIVPAGGVAVLYNGGDLNFEPARFTNTWGSGIPL